MLMPLDMNVFIFTFVSEGHLIVAHLILDSGALVNVPSGSENNIPLTLACWKGTVFICLHFTHTFVIIIFKHTVEFGLKAVALLITNCKV